MNNDSEVQTVSGTDIHTTKDHMVEMRDGVRLCTDIYRPPEADPVPALVSIAPYNKELSSPTMAEEVGTQPAWSPTWCGPAEAGDTPYFVANDYAHVIASPRGVALSEGSPDNMENPEDLYDLIEWVADREWCTGKIGMSGISAFGGWQFTAAEAKPPSLEAIFPYDTRALHPFRDRFPGGVLHTFMLHVSNFSVVHQTPRPPELEGEKRELWEEALENPDYKQHPPIYNILTMKGMKSPGLFEWLLDPYDDEELQQRVEERVEKINDFDIPIYLGTGWYAYNYKRHLRGNFRWNERLDVPKKMLLRGLPHLERPQHQLAEEAVRWYDHWLKDEDTGIMDEPFGQVRIMGANKDVYFDEWPLPETEWTDFYLHSWERLREEPLKTHSYESQGGPDVFTQQPATETRDVEKLRFMTDPLPEDTLVVGPSSLTLHAEIDQEDTTWIAALKDVGPDVSVQTARQGWERKYGSPEEWERPETHERELTRGWLKASHRAVDEENSEPGRPRHVHTREACEPVEPGAIEEYNVEILPTANLFKEGHRICVEISSLDVPTGVGGDTDVEYIPWHICNSRTTTHKIYRNSEYPSHLTLPIIPSPEQYLEDRVVE
jgi:putative CocE/NonD family hydrolase